MLHAVFGPSHAKVSKGFFSIYCRFRCLIQVGNGGGFEALAIDAFGRLINREYPRRVAAHEAGHFLVAYLTGLLPKKYILSSVDAYQRYFPAIQVM